jgi:(2Fe-2S) ferredoxin
MTFSSAHPTVTVCRGCCCGTTHKHPRIPHAEHLARLKRAVQGHANVRITDCLGPCEQSNVVVISPSRLGRAAGGRPSWFGFVLDTAAIDDLADWISTGGPGLAEHPTSLELYTIDRSDPP